MHLRYLFRFLQEKDAEVIALNLEWLARQQQNKDCAQVQLLPVVTDNGFVVYERHGRRYELLDELSVHREAALLQDLAKRCHPVRLDVQISAKVVRQILDTLDDVDLLKVLLAIEWSVQLRKLPAVLLGRL